MELSSKTRLTKVLDAYPFMVDFLVGVSSRFKLLKNPVARNTVGRTATVGQAASIGGIDVEILLAKMAAKIEQETGEAVAWSTGEKESSVIEEGAARHEVLKEIIRDLHSGADMDDVKKRFRELIRDIDPSEISKMEQRLIEEGMPESEVKRLCDVHVEVFRESLETREVPSAPEGHPVHTFMAENRACESLLAKLDAVCDGLAGEASAEEFEKYRPNLSKLLGSLRKIDLHYLRKENQLFPLMEAHDISGPSQVMWELHDDIRGMVKQALGEVEEGGADPCTGTVRRAVTMIRDMIYKEEHILYPLALEVLSEDEWRRVAQGEGEIGYAWVEPQVEWKPDGEEEVVEQNNRDRLELDTGAMTREQINLLLKSLPVDLSLVDENDRVVYYSDTKERVFPRSPGVIGRTVQKCHPPKSVHIVQRILDEFRAGKKDVAEFWIQMNGKFIHIRYFALRADDGAYRGCLEVSQDVTGIRELDGERRLPDW